MQPGRACTSGLGVPLLLLAGRVCGVAPVRPTLGLCLVVPCPSAALGAYGRAVSGASSHLFTGACLLSILCAVSVATWCLFNGVCAVWDMRVMLVALLFPSPPFCCCCRIVNIC